jgi:hypothetical protein
MTSVLLKDRTATQSINRRGLLAGLGSLLAAPAIVHAGNLMPVKAPRPLLQRFTIISPPNGGYLYSDEFAVLALQQFLDLCAASDELDRVTGIARPSLLKWETVPFGSAA